MEKSKRQKIILLITFSILELSLLIIILFSKLPVKWFCFSSVVLGFCNSLLYIKKKKNNYLMIISLLICCEADVFLVLLDSKYKLVGVIFFMIAQLCIGLYIHSFFNKKEHIIGIIIRSILNIVFIIACLLVVRDNVDALSIVSCIYFSNLIANIIISIIHIKDNPILFIGLIFFMLCDLTLGLEIGNGIYLHLSENGILYKFINLPFNFVWFFYVIAITLLSINTSIDSK